MIKTVFLDQFISLMWGSILAITVYPSIKKGGIFTKYFLRALIFQIFIFFPIGLYLFLTWPDWSWMYWVNTSTISTGVKILALSGYIISFLMGYLLSAYFIKKDKMWAAYIISGIGLAGVIIISIAGIKSLIYLGTREEFIKEVAIPVWKDPKFAISMILIGLYFGIPGAILIYQNLKENNLIPIKK